MFPNFAPESPLSREKFLSAIFNLLFEIPPSDLFKNCATVVYFILPPACERSLTSVSFYVTSFPFLVLNNNHSTKDPPGFLPYLLFPFGVRSESVRNPPDHHTQTPQKPERADDSRTQPNKNQTARPVDRSSLEKSLAKQEQNAR